MRSSRGFKSATGKCDLISYRLEHITIKLFLNEMEYVCTFSILGWSMTICPIIPISWSGDNDFKADNRQLSSGSSTDTSVRNFLQLGEP